MANTRIRGIKEASPSISQNTTKTSISQDLNSINASSSSVFAATGELEKPTAAYNLPIPFIIGSFRATGNIIWTSGIRSYTDENDNLLYEADVAVGICKGPIEGISKVWANSKLIYSDGTGLSPQDILASNELDLIVTFYNGTETQSINSTIEDDIDSKVGSGTTPAFRGLAYAVFKDFPLANFGNKIPNFSFEARTSYDLQPLNANSIGVDTYSKDSFDRLVFLKFYTYNGYYLKYNTSTPTQFELHRFNLDGDDANLGLRTSPINLTVWDHAPSEGLYTIFTQIDGSGTNFEVFVVNDAGLIPAFSFTSLSNAFTFINKQEIYQIGSYIYIGGRQSGSGHITEYYNTETNQLGNISFSNGLISPYNIAINSSGLMYTMQSFTSGAAYVYNLSGTTATFVRLIPNFFTEPDNNFSDMFFGEGDLLYVTDQISASKFNLYSVNSDDEFTKVISDIDTSTYGFEHGWIIQNKYVRFMVADARNYEVIENLYYQQFQIDAKVTQPQSLATVVSELIQAGGVDVADINTTDLTGIFLDGYIAQDFQSISEALSVLSTAYFFTLNIIDGKFTAILKSESSVETISDDDLIVNQLVEFTREQDVYEPRKVILNYIGNFQEYRPTTQLVENVGSVSTTEYTLNLPIVMTANDASSISFKLLNLYTAERLGISFLTTNKYLYLTPGDVITLNYEGSSYLVQLVQMFNKIKNIEFQGFILNSGLYEGEITIEDSDLGLTDETVTISSPTEYLFFDIPNINPDQQNIGFYYGVWGLFPNSWFGATIEKSSDGGTSYFTVSSTVNSAIGGVAASTLGTALGTVLDKVNTVDVVVNAALSSISDDDFTNNANLNLAAIGDSSRWELVQFRDVTSLGGDSYRLSHLVRGKYGTEHAISTHGLTDKFILLDSNIEFLQHSDNDLLITQYFKVVSEGNPAEDPSPFTFKNFGINLKPYSVSHIKGFRDSSGDLSITWVRRNRLYGEWRDLADVPMSEESESYQVDVLSGPGGTVKRSIEGLSSPTITYTAAQQTTDFGSTQSSITVQVWQNSSIVGAGYVTEITL